MFTLQVLDYFKTMAFLWANVKLMKDITMTKDQVNTLLVHVGNQASRAAAMKAFPINHWLKFMLVFIVGCNSPQAMRKAEPTSTPTASLGTAVTSSVPPTALQPTSSPSPIKTPTLELVIFRPSIKVTGTEEMVYDWSEHRCADEMLPDLPVRPFRDADGMVNVNLSFTTNYRMTGADLDSLKPDCQPTMHSDFDIDPGDFNYGEWMGSTYTLDGKIVYALIHNEFHGDNASRWYANRDFSAEQGKNDWKYLAWDGSTYREMRYDSAHRRWQGFREYCQISSSYMHPDVGCQPSRTWISPVDAVVTLSGVVRDEATGGGNGVTAMIFKGDEELWKAVIANGDKQEYSYNLEVDVKPGDDIHFKVDARGDSGWDTTYFNPKINIGQDPCVSNIRDNCFMMSITFAISTDGGKTFTQPDSPDHLVATMPYRFRPNLGEVGLWQPSNIVQHPTDGYYYALMESDIHFAGKPWNQGMCVMRTKTLQDPKSWRAWDGADFNLRFANPYLEAIPNPEKATCHLVSQNNVGALSYSLTYNTYFGKFIAVGTDSNSPIKGFYYSLSDDLVHWTPRKLLMEAVFGQQTNWTPPWLAYPSLIDPNSPARNFDVTGQYNYLYYTRIVNMNPLEFDLLRVQVQLSK